MKDTESFAPAAITLSTDDSFIEFENDKKYTYKTGYSYLIRSGSHRIFNLSDKNRYTLCVTPEENLMFRWLINLYEEKFGREFEKKKKELFKADPFIYEIPDADKKN